MGIELLVLLVLARSFISHIKYVIIYFFGVDYGRALARLVRLGLHSVRHSDRAQPNEMEKNGALGEN